MIREVMGLIMTGFQLVASVFIGMTAYYNRKSSKLYVSECGKAEKAAVRAEKAAAALERRLIEETP